MFIQPIQKSVEFCEFATKNPWSGRVILHGSDVRVIYALIVFCGTVVKVGGIVIAYYIQIITRCDIEVKTFE